MAIAGFTRVSALSPDDGAVHYTWMIFRAGADVNVAPPTRKDHRSSSAKFDLQAVNRGNISAYTLDVGRGRTFYWDFVVAEVPYPIIWADHLHDSSLYPDLWGRRLVDAITTSWRHANSHGRPPPSGKLQQVTIRAFENSFAEPEQLSSIPHPRMCRSPPRKSIFWTVNVVCAYS